MTECDIYREMISEMLDGELSEPQKTELMTHLATCRDCARVYDAFAFISSSIDEGAEPPASLAADVMSSIAAKGAKSASAKKRGAVLPRLAALAACLAIVIFAASKTNILGARSASAPSFMMHEETGSASGENSADSGAQSTPASAYAQGDSTQELSAPPAEYSVEAPVTTEGTQPRDTVQAMDVSMVRLFSGDVDETAREPIMTVTSEDALAAIMDMLEFSAAGDGAEVSGDPVFVVSVTPAESDEYSVSVWIVEGRLYCVDDRDGTLYIAAGDASDLFAMIAVA